MGSEIVKAGERALSTSLYDVADPMGAVEQMGRWFAKSGLFGVKSPEQGVILAMICMAERKSPTQIINAYHIINGRLSKRADAMHSEFLARGGRVKWKESTREYCTAVFSHQEYAPAGNEVTVTLDELEKAGVADRRKGMYCKFPRQMLRARCISEGVRMTDPAVNAGMYTEEEVSSFDDDSAAERAPSDVVQVNVGSQDSGSIRESTVTFPVARCRAAVAKFEQFSVSRYDLEDYLGGDSDGPISMSDWEDTHLAVLGDFYKELAGMAAEDRKAYVSSRFGASDG